MHLPNYRDGSIVNLMSTILNAGGVRTRYKPLRILDPAALREATNIVLVVIDGLGYEFLKRHGCGTVLHKHWLGRITSVFPSATATGITTFATGAAPQQHAITGWFMFLKELGTVVRILPFNPRYGGAPLDTTGIAPDSFIGHDTVFQQISAENYCLAPSYLSGSAYTRATSRGASMVSYDSLTDCFTKIAGIAGSNQERKFIYAYWAEFDSLAHDFGTESAPVQAHLKEIDRAVEAFADSIQGSCTTVLITSDHGLVNTKESDRINLREHPELGATLTLPLCGEPRVAYCYVHPSRTARFRQYVRTRLADYCDLYDSRDLIKENFFGLYEPSVKLPDRIGDYALIMKENFVIRDFMEGENEHFLSANHGGVSSKEMYVPLIRMVC
ncbi:alkaline phosphatase family protein [candidate division WOR-3 bacterium]|nr:alkaline phosphatase family protein [candidate division WOR-3 bacterium]